MYKTQQKKNYSAGILPFSILNGNVFFLLGKDSMENTWSDFGGRVELKDQGNNINTAIREFYEESLGVILSIDNVKLLLKDKSNFTMTKTKTLNGAPYYMFIVKICHSDKLPDEFSSRKQFCEYIRIDKKFKEKKEISWFSKKQVLDSIDNDNLIPLRHVFNSTLKKKRTLIKDIGIGTLC